MKKAYSKKIRLTLFSIVIAFLLVNTPMVFGSTTSTHTFASSGLINYQTSTLVFLKSVIIYGVSGDLPASFVKQISRFDLADIDFTVTNINAIKQLNPDFIALGYKDMLLMSPGLPDWNEVNQHEDWFYHDINGNRIQATTGNNWLMNPASQGWREHYVNFVKLRTDTLGYDGVFVDDVWDWLWKDLFYTPSANIPDLPNWRQSVIDFLSFVKLQISPKIVVANTPNDNEFPSAADGKMGENFLTMQSATKDINALFTLSGAGKYYLADSVNNLPYVLSGFLIAVNGPNAFFNFGNIWDAYQGYYPEFDKVTVIGNPSGSYYSYQSIYARDFANGKVLFNPSSTAYSIVLQSTYKTLEDVSVTSITVPAFSGVILKIS